MDDIILAAYRRPWRSKKSSCISQRKCTINLLKKTSKLGCKLSMLPLILITTWAKKTHWLIRNNIIDGLENWLTKLKLRFENHFMNNTTEKNIQIVYRILVYLQGTRRGELYFKKSRNEIFPNAVWASSKTETRSTTGYCASVREILVTWWVKKKSVMSRSDAEQELRAPAQGIWRNMTQKHPITTKNHFRRTKSTIRIAKNHIHHDCINHVKIDSVHQTKT